jgi:hypothetical protein
MNYPELDDLFMTAFAEATGMDETNLMFFTRFSAEPTSGVIAVIPLVYATPLSSRPPERFDNDGNKIREIKCLTRYRLDVIGADCLEFLRIFLESHTYEEVDTIFEVAGLSVEVAENSETEVAPSLANNGIEITASITLNVRHTQVTTINEDGDTTVYATKVTFEATLNKDSPSELVVEGEVDDFYE